MTLPHLKFRSTRTAFAGLLAVVIFSTLAMPLLAQDAGTKQSAVATPTAGLDDLFQQLAKAGDAGEAGKLTTAIERIWLHSGSDTADLLMGRVLTAMRKNDHALALDVLDKLIELEPDWAEAWNKRATLRFLDNDDAGSMNDISHVLQLEPRHFGALAGMGFILQRAGLDKRALQAYRQLLKINPQQADISKTVDKLTLEVEGREL